MRSMTRFVATRTAPARTFAALSLAATLAASSAAAALPVSAADEDTGSVAVTTEVLGSIVSQLVGDAGEVAVIMPSGANPHSYEPSARDAERMLNAAVLVSNGLELEEGLLSVLESAAGEGVTWFQAADHVTLLEFGDDHEAEEAEHEHDEADEHEHDEADEHEHDEADEHHDHGSVDPHIWTSPMVMVDVVEALAPVLAESGIDVTENAASLATELEALDAEVVEILAVVPEDQRRLVTGHRSLGYFADRYGFEQTGTVIPSLSTSGEPTAKEMAQLIEDIREHEVKAVFAEVGTPQSVAQAVAGDSGAELVELSAARLPEDGTYQDLIRDMATTIAGALGE
jgi:zinc/manganese transport system substrate-binding protein